jgi:hypothetical protein
VSAFLLGSQELFILDECQTSRVQCIELNSNVLAHLNRKHSQQQQVIYMDLLYVVSAKLAAGCSIEDILFLCESAYKDVISFYKQNRKSCQLISLSAYLADYTEDESFNSVIKLANMGEELSPIYTLSASMLLQQNKVFAKLATKLQACSIAESNLKLETVIEPSLTSYNLQRIAFENEIKTLQEDLKVSQASNAGAKQDLIASEQQRQKLESGFENTKTHLNNIVDELKLEVVKASQELTSAQDEIAKTNQQLQVSQASNSELQAENDLLVEQLHQTQETLVEALTEKSQQEQEYLISQQRNEVELKTAQDSLAKTDKQLQVSQASNSELQAENDLLIKQLHHVQETLECCFIELDDINELNHQVQGLTKTLNDAREYEKWLRLALSKSNKLLFQKNRGFRNSIKDKAKLIKRSEVFDEEWYLQTYPDLKDTDLDLAIHYLLYGAYEARNPSGIFDTLNYLQSYPDVIDSNMSPIVHYINFGQLEGRQPNPMQKRLPALKG